MAERTIPARQEPFHVPPTNGPRVTCDSKIGRVGTVNGPTPPCPTSDKATKTGEDIDA